MARHESATMIGYLEAYALSESLMRAIPFAILIFSFFSAAHAEEPGTPAP